MLKNKNAVITGSSSGIGLGIAEKLASDGCNIVINSYTDTESDHEIAANLAKKYDVKAEFISADMSKAEECESLITQSQDIFGSVDVLVNNAGIQYVSPIEDFPVAKWDAIIAINMSSAFHTCRSAVTNMKTNGWGRIINIASAHGLTASPYKSAYVAAKHGLVGMSKVVALEMAEARVNVTCNTVCPGYVWTPLVEGQLKDQMESYGKSRKDVIENILLTRQPTKQFATVEQIGGVISFLCSDAADQITGTSISVDGGWTAL